MKTPQRFTALSPDILSRSHIVGIGSGGASGLYIMLARAGVAELSISDIDHIETKNLHRQPFFPNDVGKLKVEALREQLLQINPAMTINVYTENIIELPLAVLETRFTSATAFLFMTDRFWPQAFGNLLSLYFQCPAIWAGYYPQSQCSELFFSHPQFSTSCFRCCVSDRYRINEKEEFLVSSEGSSIFHTELLNAQIGMILMALLHNDTEEYGFSNWFGDVVQKPFFHHQVHPDYSNTVFDRAFAKAKDHTFCFQSAWQTIEPEHLPKYDPCPDCGGSGDLTKLTGIELAKKIKDFQKQYDLKMKP